LADMGTLKAILPEPATPELFKDLSWHQCMSHRINHFYYI